MLDATARLVPRPAHPEGPIVRRAVCADARPRARATLGESNTSMSPAARRSETCRRAWLVLLANFVATRPRYEVTQPTSLAWLADAHAEAEAALAQLDDAGKRRFAAKIANVLARCGCPPDKLARRGHSLPELDVSRFAADPRGRSAEARTRLFAEIVDAYFTHAYEAEREPPDDLIHVTCTGYVSPNGAQKLVAARGWRTRITNAYQMGCYAAVPAVRMAAGFTAIGARRVDIVHTELCSLHFHSDDHAIEQLVVQSLFADGLIRYATLRDDDGPGLRLLGWAEQVLGDSAGAMGWRVSDRGMRMTLARDVPDRIAAALRGFVIELYQRAGLGLDAIRDSVFAVHPGGPKIIDRVREVLELDEPQVRASRDVLHDFGNMSSATLPHIWMRLLADPAVPRGTLIPSLAFGPGLTVCGAVFEKQ